MPRILCKPQDHYCVYNSPPLALIFVTLYIPHPVCLPPYVVLSFIYDKVFQVGSFLWWTGRENVSLSEWYLDWKFAHVYAYTIQWVTLLSHDTVLHLTSGILWKTLKCKKKGKDAIILPYVSHISFVKFRAVNVCATLPPFHWKTFWILSRETGNVILIELRSKTLYTFEM